ncbi:putative membrane protein [Bacteroides fragilis str. 3725 D9(v)]|nr:putative membrane protein [Bacteroides fragilis str. 3725 D9(v)]KDS15250.1 putative membrane protein [Bacteroides ovatus str. 3725 D1 iv]KDS16420.1 putative membrane protein [Bacteroides fragilis str. 3725 D9 ii]
MLYKEFKTQRKNVFFILLTIGIIFMFNYNAIYLKKYFF